MASSKLSSHVTWYIIVLVLDTGNLNFSILHLTSVFLLGLCKWFDHISIWNKIKVKNEKLLVSQWVAIWKNQATLLDGNISIVPLLNTGNILQR